MCGRAACLPVTCGEDVKRRLVRVNKPSIYQIYGWTWLLEFQKSFHSRTMLMCRKGPFSFQLHFLVQRVDYPWRWWIRWEKNCKGKNKWPNRSSRSILNKSALRSLNRREQQTNPHFRPLNPPVVVTLESSHVSLHPLLLRTCLV